MPLISKRRVKSVIESVVGLILIGCLFERTQAVNYYASQLSNAALDSL